MPRPRSAEAREIATECLASRARHLDRQLARLYDGALRRHGVTGAQLGMLVAIELSGPTTAAAVGRLLGLEKSTVSRNLARLGAAGLVRDSEGLAVTARGAAIIRDAHPAWRSAQRQAVSLLGKRASRLLASLPGPTPRGSLKRSHHDRNSSA